MGNTNPRSKHIGRVKSLFKYTWESLQVTITPKTHKRTTVKLKPHRGATIMFNSFNGGLIVV